MKAVEGYASEQFDFDPAGNILGGSATGNRLQFHGDRHFTYDTRGNLIAEQRGTGGKLSTTYTYNCQNQLVQVEKDGQTFQYAYDALGRRVRKQDAFGETEFLWNGDVLLCEQRGHAQKLYLYEPGSFKPLAFLENNQCYFYHNDHLGTPQELTDWQGQIVWSARYRTYGNVLKHDVETVENNLRFQGQYFDAETGLHYNRFRYYDPGTGRFTQQDPVGLLGGINNYQYAVNPTGWIDPLGLTCKERSPEVLPDNYDFLTDKYVNPVNKSQLDHNKTVDIEELINAESPNFLMRDMNMVENAKIEYAKNPVNQVIDYHEFLAIRAYTDDLYQGINPALRSGNPGKWEGLVSSANTGLEKLARHPDYAQGGSMTRGMDLSDEDVAKLFPDDGTFSDKAFISSSYDSKKAFNKSVELSVETVNPQARVGNVSVYGDAEAEVLFRTDSRFDVISKEKLPNGKWKIHVKEKS